jgi:GT2 family glycosyltransferase
MLPDQLFVVLVLYERALADSAAFQSLTAALRALSVRVPLLVYDNSPVPTSDPAALESAECDVRYVHDPTNPGVGRAYLEGARAAAQESRSWLLLLDQDTTLPADALAKYAAAIDTFPSVRLFAPVLRSAGKIVSPCAYRLKRGRSLPSVEPGPQSLAGRSLLNSGLCVAVADYLAVGGHDVRISLDWSDHEFVNRFKRRHRLMVVVDFECEHNLFALAPQSTASRLLRFRGYCRGARRTIRGPLDAVLTAGLVLARACLLAARHRSGAFLRIPFETMREERP